MALAAAIFPTQAWAANCSDAGVNIAVTRESSPVLYFDPASNQNPKLNASYVQYRITNNTGSEIPDLWVKLQNFSGTKVSLAATEDGVAHVGPFPAGSTKNVYFLLGVSGIGSSQTHNVGLYTSNPSLVTNTCLQNFSYSTLDAIAANANKVTSISISPNPPQLGGTFNIVVTGDTGTVGAARIFSMTPSGIAAWQASAFELSNVSVVLTGGNTGTITNDLFFTLANAADTHYVTTYTFRAKSPTTSRSNIYPVSYISSGTQIKHTDTGNMASLGSIQPVTNQIVLGATTASPGQSPSCLGGGGGTSLVTVNITNSGSNAVTLDDIEVTLPSSPAAVTLDGSFTETYDGVALPVSPTVSGNTVTWTYTFTVPAGSTKALVFQVNIPGTNGSYAIQAIGHIDGTVIDTSANTNLRAPSSVELCVGPTPTPTPTPTHTATPTPTSSARDSDNDGIPDSDEGSDDSDGDGTKDRRDTDTDNDGIPDSEEGTDDTDDDGVPDYRDRDSDNDGIPDVIEGGGEDSDGDGQADDDEDTDGDGPPDTYDPDNGGTEQPTPDTDSDGIPDYKDSDSDGDGIRDVIEGQTDDKTRPPSGDDEDGDGIDDAYDPDQDGRHEIEPPDTDGDGTPDYRDTDSDNDVNPDSDEAFDDDGDGNPDVTPSGNDSDDDGLDDAYEDYRRFRQLDEEWRTTGDAEQCTRRRISAQVASANTAAAALNSRAESFAQTCRACGGPGQSARVARAADAYGRLTPLLSSTFTGITYTCPQGVCTKSATSRVRTRMLKLANALAAEAKAIKSSAIKACKTPPSSGEDSRKNNDDYLADLRGAINGLPANVTRCGGQ